MPLAQLISATELNQRLQQEPIVLIDCRFALEDVHYGRNSFNQSHIVGAHYLDLDQDLSSPVIKGTTGRHPLPDAQALSARLRQCGLNHDSTVVLYDDGPGAFAAHAWWLLIWLGKTDRLYLLDGGLKAWRAQALPETSEPTPTPLGNFQGQANPERVISAEALASKLNTPTLSLLDARALARFRGEAEPIDPVAGHIPGAQCAVFTDNLTAEGFFLSPTELQARFDGLLGARPKSEVIAYCGSGVTACHNLFAMSLAGYPLPRLYAGSWSEWITSAERPIARGD